MPLYINLSGEERVKYIREGAEWLLKNDPEMVESDAEAYVKQKLDECTNPEAYEWATAPKKMRDRFEIKMGMRAKNKKKGIRRELQAKIRTLTKKRTDMSIANELLSMSKFSKEEEKFIRNLVSKYMNEFTFNETSDRNLVKSLIVEEFKLEQLNGKYLDIKQDFTTQDIKIKKECQDNILKLQQNLGITRQQRDAEMEKNQKSIAELSVTLENKLDQMNEQEVIEMEEELGFFREKMEREPMNLPLMREEMESILASSDRDELSKDQLELANEIARKSAERQAERDSEAKHKENKHIVLPDAELV